ncbi:hypothetical protein [Streptomyces sp. NPDC056713]|uniref:hypothetical protein n=1 Tax=Streptomyces sp. NPDC056713 TaxID=3345921 RepID=UPI003699DD59
MIAVAQQMRKVVRQFGVVHEDQIRASGAVQVDQVHPQAEPDPEPPGPSPGSTARSAQRRGLRAAALAWMHGRLLRV